jgi:hypothetical protein
MYFGDEQNQLPLDDPNVFIGEDWRGGGARRGRHDAVDDLNSGGAQAQYGGQGGRRGPPPGAHLGQGHGGHGHVHGYARADHGHGGRGPERPDARDGRGYGFDGQGSGYQGCGGFDGQGGGSHAGGYGSHADGYGDAGFGAGYGRDGGYGGRGDGFDGRGDGYQGGGGYGGQGGGGSDAGGGGSDAGGYGDGDACSGAVPDQLSRAVGRVRPRARIISFARCRRALLLGRGGVVAGGGASTRTSAADYSRPGLISGLQIDATSVVLSRLFSFFRRTGGPGGRGRRAAQKEAGTPTVYGPAGPVLANGRYLRAPNRCHVGRFESSLLVLSADRSPPGAWATSRTE